MKIPDKPSNEDDRLINLHSLSVLDTAEEERFDRVTRLAKRLFNVPIAIVSLVDQNRQWFKSCFGLSTKETSRDISFCGHTILNDEPFIIPDATQDKRFYDNPLVKEEPFIRFYAGCPLSFSDGTKLGTLCIIDQVPRNLTDEDISSLIDLAQLAERELNAIQAATMDELTMISNRRGFTLLFQHTIAQCKRDNTHLALAFLDLNEFKPINDNFGHAEGDKALTAFANLMKTCFRDADVFARLGGDEFAVLMVGNSIDEAKVVINRFRQSVNQYNREAKRGYDISFSEGIVLVNPNKETSIDDLLNEADAKMYQQKAKLTR